MKIGIITWYSGSNYGTHLQAIALQWKLRDQGHDAQIIDYDKKLTRYKRTFKNRLFSQPKKYFLIVAGKKYKNAIKRRNQRLNEAIVKHCVLSSKAYNIEEFIDVCNSYDLLIVGSDQLWNPNWYSKVYYADFEKVTTSRIAYAPSIGVNSIPIEMQEPIRESLSKFSAISVREEAGAQLIERLGLPRPQVVVDPTLLLNSDEWLRVFSKKCDQVIGDYVLTMFLDDRLRHWHAANEFVQTKRMEHVVVPYMGYSYIQKGTICADAGLDELINLIFGASYIITDSFHISVFSMIFRKQFFTFERFKENQTTSTNERIRNLLRLAELENRLIPFNSEVILDRGRIDYSQMEHFEQERNKSNTYLLNAINDFL